MSIDSTLLRKIVEGALLAADGPLSVARIAALFDPGEEGELDFDSAEKPSNEEILATLEDIQADCKNHGYELKEVGSGWRFQVVQEVAPWINRLWEEKPQKYSRALLETLVLIAYRQPITRGDIESIRGVAVSSNIIKTLTERDWVKVVGHRDVPGRPALYATTREFLDYFNLQSLDELPSLKEIQDLDKYDSFDFGDGGDAGDNAGDETSPDESQDTAEDETSPDESQDTTEDETDAESSPSPDDAASAETAETESEEASAADAPEGDEDSEEGEEAAQDKASADIIRLDN